MKKIPLGRATPPTERYDPDLLFPIERAASRERLGPAADRLSGIDVWHLLEVGWLDTAGKPEVRCARLTYPADSACIVESKSLKLYLNGMAMTRFDSPAAVIATVTGDLGPVLQTDHVRLELIAAAAPVDWQSPPAGACADDLAGSGWSYDYDPGLLAAADEPVEDATLVSHLLRTTCPVTGQPDWGTVRVDYSARRRLDPAAFLRYLVSFRRHQDYHEACCETIFRDLFDRLAPDALTVHCGFTRRGGIAISPVRVFGRPLDGIAAARRWPRQ
jgi:7-cyano-7-deazaguanine reductase